MEIRSSTACRLSCLRPIPMLQSSLWAIPRGRGWTCGAEPSIWPAAGSNVDPRHPDRQTGGDASFRTALTGPLRQAVEERMPLDPARRTLWGHSYGGLFTISTLFASPESFRCWVPVSPSTGFGEGALFVAERTARRVPGGIAPVHILLGDRERRRNSSAASTPAPSPQTMALVERLGERPDLAVRVTVLEGLGHGATFAASFPAAFAAGAV